MLDFGPLRNGFVSEPDSKYQTVAAIGGIIGRVSLLEICHEPPPLKPELRAAKYKFILGRGVDGGITRRPRRWEPGYDEHLSDRVGPEDKIGKQRARYLASRGLYSSTGHYYNYEQCSSASASKLNGHDTVSLTFGPDLPTIGDIQVDIAS